MVTRLENDIFDIMVEPSNWRYSAAIVGLSRYFEDRDKMEDEDYEVDEDCIKFCSDSITKEEFLLFAESYYGEEFPHVQVEEILSRKEFSKEMIDLVNKLLKENSIMKKVFSKKKFDGSNQEELLELIDENRLVLIRETFRNKKVCMLILQMKVSCFKKSQTFAVVCRDITLIRAESREELHLLLITILMW